VAIYAPSTAETCASDAKGEPVVRFVMSRSTGSNEVRCNPSCTVPLSD